MRLGIDFGTTHTVAAAVDRGNYPVAGFEWGDAIPSVIAAHSGSSELRSFSKPCSARNWLNPRS